MDTPKPSRPKRPRDINQLAHQVFLESIGEAEAGGNPDGTAKPARASSVIAAGAKPPTEPEPEKPAKNLHAVALSKLGASKGGKARTGAMTAAERSELAKKAAQARWGKPKTN